MSEAQQKRLSFTVLNTRLAACRLEPDAKLPAWAHTDRAFVSITRTKEELSIIIDEAVPSSEVQCVGGWRLIKAEGPFDFALTGIVAAIGDPLRDAGISILWVSTFDTDYILVKQESLERCIAALEGYGHQVAR